MTTAAYWMAYSMRPYDMGNIMWFAKSLIDNVQKHFCIMQNVRPFIRRYLDQI